MATQNVAIQDKGDKIVLTIAKQQTLAEAGTQNKAGKVRKYDLVATTGGFDYQTIDGFGVSVNVTRKPQS